MEAQESSNPPSTPSATRSASAPVTPTAPASPSPASSPARPRWTDDETSALFTIVEEQKGSTIDWDDVAKKLAETSPLPAGRSARTKTQCRQKWRRDFDNPDAMKRASSVDGLPSARSRSAKRPPSFDVYETDIRKAGPYGKGDLPQLNWSESSVAQLLAAVEALEPGTELRETKDWEKIGAKLSPPRSARSCMTKMARLKKQEVSDADAASTRKNPTIELTTSSNETPPEPSTYEPPVSVADQPFSAEDDIELLRLNDIEPGGWHKWISRQMKPKRHKKEVKERLDYLLSARKNEELGEGGSYTESLTTTATPIAVDQSPALPSHAHDDQLQPPPSKRARLSPDAVSPDSLEADETSREVALDQFIQRGVLASVGELSSLESEPAKESTAAPSEKNDVAMEVEDVAEPLLADSHQSTDLKLDSISNLDSDPGALSRSSPTRIIHISSTTSMRDASTQTASSNFISRPSTIAEPKGTFEEALWALEELSKPLWGPL